MHPNEKHGDGVCVDFGGVLRLPTLSQENSATGWALGQSCLDAVTVERV